MYRANIDNRKPEVIKRSLGEKMYFTGGAENTPMVTVGFFNAPLSLNHGEKNFRIRQFNPETRREEMVILSMETMRAILQWGEEK